MPVQYLFVCGCARSGTSILQRLLVSHPSVALGVERYLRLFTTGKLTPDLFEKQRFFDVREGDTFYDDLWKFSPVYQRIAERYDTSTVRGDKIPRLYRNYDAVLEQFPQAKFVFISRNLWDVASSFKRRAADPDDRYWGSGRGVAVAIQEWNEAHLRTVEFQAKHPQQVLAVSYETLFGDWVGLKRLFDFVAVPITPEVRRSAAQFKKAGEKVRSERPEVLEAAEKLEIFRRGAFDAYRQLCESMAIPPLQAPVNAPKPGAAKPASRQVAPAADDEQDADAPLRGKYQAMDRRICNYHYERVPDSELLARGPLPADLGHGRFVACIGGAQTLGRFVEHPYPELAGELTGWPVLNLGTGGGKPEYYLHKPGSLDVLNRAACVVVQIMSARGSPNALIQPVTVDNNIVDYRGPKPERLFINKAYAQMIKDCPADTVLAAIEESRNAYIEEMSALLRAITAPKILLWLSVRTPHYAADPAGVSSLLGDYPQLVDARVVAALRPLADAYAECASNRGMPYELRDRKTGERVEVFPWRDEPAVNDYYPSAEMHEDAAALLAPEIRRRLGAFTAAAGRAATAIRNNP